MIKIIRVILITCALVLCQGCSYGIQTTSGASYLKRYSDVPLASASAPSEKTTFAEQLKMAAKVEPVLKFPARIGIARVGSSGLISIPAKELEHWEGVERELGRDFGTFVPITQLGVRLAKEATNEAVAEKETRVHGAMNQVRLAAARQHLDAVLIYEAVDSFESKRNALSVLDIALVTLALVPSRNLISNGSAHAVLIDPMQGYHYGSAQAQSKERSSMSTAVDVDDEQEALAKEVQGESVLNLTKEVEKMLNRLSLRIARLKK